MSAPAARARPGPALQRAGKSLPELSIQRHVFAYMLSGALLLFGVISFDRIGVDRFPKIDFPAISIRTVLPGASPEIIDSSIANIIETSVNSVPGIEHIRSTAAPGVSVVIVRFGLDKDVDIGFNEVQAKINQILPRLPKEAPEPKRRERPPAPPKPSHPGSFFLDLEDVRLGKKSIVFLVHTDFQVESFFQRFVANDMVGMSMGV